MTLRTFNLATTPQLHFGAGTATKLPAILKTFGSTALLVTGMQSFLQSSAGKKLMQLLDQYHISIDTYSISSEPTPQMIDAAVSRFNPKVVVAIGGGSALDAGKAIAAMLPLRRPVRNYLEGVGMLEHPGVKVPFVALPTTAGTGSEATKNAVIAETGEHGYKKSLRHNNFIPDTVIIDPELMVTCPPSITASSGMDAFTQLLESYLSTKANPVTETLALEGLTCLSTTLLPAYRDGSNMMARTDMALAAYLSGVTLANAGLGLVHGFASSIGGYFAIPHGVICSRLMGPANRYTVQRLRKGNANSQALMKYATVGRMFTTKTGEGDPYYVDALLDLIDEWTDIMSIPGLGSYGVTTNDLERIVAITNNKTNPVVLKDDEMKKVLEAAL